MSRCTVDKCGCKTDKNVVHSYGCGCDGCLGIALPLSVHTIEYRCTHEWISVKDRLPEEGQPVLMIRNIPLFGEEAAFASSIYVGLFIKGDFRSDSDSFPEVLVTHWCPVPMPLPEPPKEEK